MTAGFGGFFERLGARTQLTEPLTIMEDRAQVARILTATVSISAAVSALGAVTYFRFDEPVAGLGQLGLGVGLFIALAAYLASGRIDVAVTFGIGISVANSVLGHLSLGGYGNSGGHLLWTIILTVIVAVVLGARPAVLLAVGAVILGVVLAGFEARLIASRPPVDPALPPQLFAFLLIGSLVIIVPLLLFLLRRLRYERARAESLLHNTLPDVIVSELKEHGNVAATRFESASVLFADIVGFTHMSEELAPEEMVARLNEVFTFFDSLSERHGCEKIRTIGDNYMVASGVPVPRDDHAQVLTVMGLEMLDYAETSPFSFRIGINSGTLVAGVVGTSKFQYDVWGDTVNTASRMESHGEPGRLQIGKPTHELISGEFVCTYCGPIDVKGKGQLETWFVESRRSPQ